MPRPLQANEFCGNHVDGTYPATRIISRPSRKVTNAFEPAILSFASLPQSLLYGAL
jgi:hypothetical protein